MEPDTMLELSGPGGRPHWRCPDCGQPCTCSGLARDLRLPHERCGLTRIRTMAERAAEEGR
jgi:hypothetical protein